MTSYSSYYSGHMGQSGKARAFSASVLLTICVGIAACGSSGSTPSGSNPSVAATSPTPAAAGYAANLTFTGALAGSTTQAKAPKDAKPSTCSGGTIEVAVTLNGHDYDLLVINVQYKSPGTYKIGDQTTGITAVFSDAAYGGTTEYTSTTGTVTYKNEKSITIDANLTSGAKTAHISGSAACA